MLSADQLTVFFDVDDTLLTWDHRLRPFARPVIEAAHHAGFAIFLWSGAGLRWEVADAYSLRPFVRDCFHKPLSRYHERLAGLGVPFTPHHVVDDDEDIVAAFGGTHVPAPLEPLQEDRELLRVLSDLETRFSRPVSGFLR